MKNIDQENNAVFFDRDGVLNQLVKRDDSYYSPQKYEDFHIIKGVKEVIGLIREMNYLVIVVSYQPDISRGKLKQSDLNKMTNILYEDLGVDCVYYCTHDDNNDIGCRKPSPGLFLAAQKDYNINFKKSFMVGDTWKDVEAAKKTDIPMVLLDKPYNKNIQDVERVETLYDIISIIKDRTNI